MKNCVYCGAEMTAECPVCGGDQNKPFDLQQNEPDGMLALSIAVAKGDFPHTTDAKIWADEFNKTLVKLGHQPHDPAWLVGWFANAIMAGFDAKTKAVTA